MKKELYLVSFVVVLMFVGCTTARQPSTLNQLQIKVAHLEKKIDDKDFEINELKSELQYLSERIKDLDRSPEDLGQQKEVAPSDNGSSTNVFSPSISTDSKVTTTGVIRTIRVSASAIEVQTALKNAGYYLGSLDGKIGSQSREAVRVFQKDHDLKVDGIVGEKTWSELKYYLN